MNAAAAPQSRSLPIGMALSVGLHVLIAAYVLVSFSRPQALAAPADLTNAIAISMEPFRPKPPPEPPKPITKPDTPKDVVTTTAPEPDVQVAAAPEDAAPPAPQEEPTSSAPSAASYASIVAGIIQRNKRYPRDALVDGIEGVVESYFVVNHQGHVIGYRIEQGSGQRQLDQEVVRLLKYVKFPPIPDDGGDPERREFRLPITFRISG